MLRRGERDNTENKKNSTVLLWKLGRVIWILTVVMGLLGICIQSKAVQSVILYTHVMNYPFWLHDTAYHGLPEARNIKVTLPDGSHLNGWHILPAGEIAIKSTKIKDLERRHEYFDMALRSADAVVLSLHGKAGNRGSKHRVAEYRMLTSQVSHNNCHVLVIDYRGFGDSMGWPPFWPSEESTAEDTIALWHWLEERMRPPTVKYESAKKTSDAYTSTSGESNMRPHNDSQDQINTTSVFIYGHSLGCAISIQLASHLSSSQSPSSRLSLSGMILVAPFTSIPEVASVYPYTSFLRFVPYAADVIERHFHFTYCNLNAIAKVTCPTLILHGDEDRIIPIEHGRRLTDAYINSERYQCTRIETSTSHPALNSVQHDCLDEQYENLRHISFVAVPDCGHNWVFTKRAWLGSVPAFIRRFM